MIPGVGGGGRGTRHCDVGAVVEVGREKLRVDGSRHEDDLEVFPLAEQPPQQYEEEVAVEAPLVHLVDDDVCDAGE
jgi:hypothetical protein